MSEDWMNDTPLGEWLKRSFPNRARRSHLSRVMSAATMLRVAGWLGATYCTALIVWLIYSWFAWRLGGADGVYPLFGPRITEYGLRLVVFLLAYAAGAILPVVIRPADKHEQP